MSATLDQPQCVNWNRNIFSQEKAFDNVAYKTEPILSFQYFDWSHYIFWAAEIRELIGMQRDYGRTRYLRYFSTTFGFRPQNTQSEVSLDSSNIKSWFPAITSLWGWGKVPGRKINTHQKSQKPKWYPNNTASWQKSLADTDGKPLFLQPSTRAWGQMYIKLKEK